MCQGVACSFSGYSTTRSILPYIDEPCKGATCSGVIIGYTDIIPWILCPCMVDLNWSGIELDSVCLCNNNDIINGFQQI